MNVRAAERCRRKEERSKQGHTKNKAKQHTTHPRQSNEHVLIQCLYLLMREERDGIFGIVEKYISRPMSLWVEREGGVRKVIAYVQVLEE